MQAFPSSCRTPARRAGLIVVAVLAVAGLAAGAALLESPEHPAFAMGPHAAGAAATPAPAAPTGDPSLPSAAAVFQDRRVGAEEPAATF